MRRQYETASAESAQVLLDGKPLITPAGKPCVLPTAQLAAAVAAEWQAQEEQIKPDTMPLTQLAMTAIDRIPAARAEVETALLRYIETELVCHYAAQPDTAAHQRTVWQPLHDWVLAEFGVTLPVTTALTALPAADTSWAALHIAAYSDYQLCALQVAADASTSLVIALALIEEAITAEQATAATEAETDAQAKEWGSDPEHERRRAALLAELSAVQTFVSLL